MGHAYVLHVTQTVAPTPQAWPLSPYTDPMVLWVRILRHMGVTLLTGWVILAPITLDHGPHSCSATQCPALLLCLSTQPEAPQAEALGIPAVGPLG
jgi:hypothetical protein